MAAIRTIIFNPVKTNCVPRWAIATGWLPPYTRHYLPDRVYSVDGDPFLARGGTEHGLPKLQQNNTQFPEVIAGIFNRLPDWASGSGGSQPDQRPRRSRRSSPMSRYRVDSIWREARSLIGKGTFGFAISLGIMLYLLFFLLKDGPLSGAPDPRLAAAV